MTTVHVPPQRRFLRVVRTLALVSTIATPVIVSVGCSSSSDAADDSGSFPNDTGIGMIDAGISTSPDGDTYPTGTLPPPDTGHDSNDDADAYDGTADADAYDGTADAAVDAIDDAAADVADGDAAIDSGGPLRAPEMPDEGVA